MGAPEKHRVTSQRGRGPRQQKREERQRVAVGERLAQARRLVVLGDPGARKTTLTRWIATAYAPPET